MRGDGEVTMGLFSKARAAARFADLDVYEFNEWKETGAAKYALDVVGANHHVENVLAATKAATDKWVRNTEGGNTTFFNVIAAVVPDDGNEYDSNAVAVYANGLLLGHLARHNCAPMRAMFAELDAPNGIKLHAMIAVPPAGRHPYVRLSCPEFD